MRMARNAGPDDLDRGDEGGVAPLAGRAGGGAVAGAGDRPGSGAASCTITANRTKRVGPGGWN